MCLVQLAIEADPFYTMARYMVQCSNLFFRICRGNGVFLSGDARRHAVVAGMDMNDACMHEKKYFSLPN